MICLMLSVTIVVGFHGLRFGWDGISRGDRPNESRRSCSSWSVSVCRLPTSESICSMEVIVGSGRREGLNLPGEQRPPPSWKGRKRCPTRAMSGNCEDVGGTPMIARLTRSSVCLLWSSRCLVASLLVRSFTVLFLSGAVLAGELVDF